MAWHLLVLRHLGRADSPRPVTRYLERERLLLLRKLLTRRRYRLPPRPTVREAMLGMAALGGHIANNGLPDGSCSVAV